MTGTLCIYIHLERWRYICNSTFSLWLFFYFCVEILEIASWHVSRFQCYHVIPVWRRAPGRPRNSWIMQIGNGSPLGIRREWKKAQDHGHHGESSQRTSAVFASWWWWWWCYPTVTVRGKANVTVCAFFAFSQLGGLGFQVGQITITLTFLVGVGGS